MASDMKKDPVPDKTTLSSKTGRTERGLGKVQNQRVLHFQGNCEELKGWVFNSTDSQGADRFDAVCNKISHYISVKYTYSMEIKSAIDKLQAISLPKPTEPEDSASQLDKDIYKEEVREC
eukprot:13023477-Ditylum_brightwellii.AAC.1